MVFNCIISHAGTEKSVSVSICEICGKKLVRMLSLISHGGTESAKKLGQKSVLISEICGKKKMEISGKKEKI